MVHRAKQWSKTNLCWRRVLGSISKHDSLLSLSWCINSFANKPTVKLFAMLSQPIPCTYMLPEVGLCIRLHTFQGPPSPHYFQVQCSSFKYTPACDSIQAVNAKISHIQAKKGFSWIWMACPSQRVMLHTEATHEGRLFWCLVVATLSLTDLIRHTELQL